MSVPCCHPRLVLLVVLLLLASVQPAAATEAERRVALVVGVGGYTHAPGLANPPRDARAMAATLGRLGFAVDLVLDPDYRGLSGALREFGRKIGTGVDFALIYFAGHGVQVEGQNFLIPADAQLERERDLIYEALPLNLFLGEVSQARRLGIMILDSCRDNPFADRLQRNAGSRPTSVRAGLSRIDDTPSDTVVAMSTRANSIAEDGAGEHSPYTQALLDELQVPGLELGLFFRRVRDRVVLATNGRQEPYVFGSYGAESVYLNPQPVNRPPAPGAAPPLEVADNAAPTPLAVPAPTDPDGDQLVVQVVGLPQGGAVLVGDRTLLIGDYLTVEQLRAAVFRPDGSQRGEVGSFDYTVSDGRGGLTKGAVAVVVVPSNRPPVVAAETTFRAVVNRLALPLPSDPDGDQLTVRVRAVPERGRLRQGGKALVEPGDRLDPEALGALTFDPEDTPPGPAGRFDFTVEDGQGGEASGSISIEVVETSAGGSSGKVEPLDEALWRRLGPQAGEAELRAFAQLFPTSPLAVEARRRLEPAAAAAVSSGPPLSHPTQAVARGDEAGGPGKGTGVPTSTGRPVPAGPEPPAPTTPPATLPSAAPPAASPAFPAPPSSSAAVAAAEPLSSSASQTSTPRTNGDGTSFQDCPNCPVMVRVPAGSFTMGRNDGDRSERPAHKVMIAKPFSLGRYEVTAAEWQACVAGGGCAEMPTMKDLTSDTPVYNLTFDDASAYVAWLARKTGRRYRLPSEAEWEYAARAGTTTPYWWGERADGAHVVCRKCSSSTAFNKHAPPAISIQPANPWGLVGMSGSVREWLADCWFKTYDKAPTDGSPRLAKGCAQHVTRGGSWLDEPEDLTVSTRAFYDASVPYILNGLRVARDLD